MLSETSQSQRDKYHTFFLMQKLKGSLPKCGRRVSRLGGVGAKENYIPSQHVTRVFGWNLWLLNFHKLGLATCPNTLVKATRHEKRQRKEIESVRLNKKQIRCSVAPDLSSNYCHELQFGQVLLSHGAGALSQGLVYARQVLCPWAMSSALLQVS